MYRKINLPSLNQSDQSTLNFVMYWGIMGLSRKSTLIYSKVYSLSYFSHHLWCLHNYNIHKALQTHIYFMHYTFMKVHNHTTHFATFNNNQAYYLFGNDKPWSWIERSWYEKWTQQFLLNNSCLRLGLCAKKKDCFFALD